MAKTLTQSVGCKGLERAGAKSKAKAKSEKPKKLSKVGEWMRAHPNGLEGTYDMRAVMK